MFENGTISEYGRYEELKNKNGVFSNFIKSYLESFDQTKQSSGNNECLSLIT